MGEPAATDDVDQLDAMADADEQQPRRPHDRVPGATGSGPSDKRLARNRENHPNRCTHVRPDGSRCKRYAVTGTTVCTAHGGALPTVRTAASRLVNSTKANQILARYGIKLRPMADPVVELERLTQEERGWLDALDEHIAKLLDSGDVRYESENGLEQLRGEVAMWNQARDRLAKLLVDQAKLNLDERRVRLTEMQGAIIVGMFEALLDRLELSPEQAKAAPTIVRELMRSAAIEAESTEVARAS